MGIYVEASEHCLLAHKSDDPSLSLAGVFVAELTMAGMLTTLLYKQHLKTPLQK